MTDLCRHGLPAWSCADPLRAPGTDDEPSTDIVVTLPRWAVYLPLAASIIAAVVAVAWRVLR